MSLQEVLIGKRFAQKGDKGLLLEFYCAAGFLRAISVGGWEGIREIFWRVLRR